MQFYNFVTNMTGDKGKSITCASKVDEHVNPKNEISYTSKISYIKIKVKGFYIHG